MRLVLAMFLLLAVVGLISCKEDDSTSSQMVPYPQRVMISISGNNVTNATISPGMGNSTLFLAYPSRVEPGMTVWMQYQGPSMMSSGPGMQMMYDDGTHGDRMAGDGEYCYEDMDGMSGMHMDNSMMGHYSYEFYCRNSGGTHGMHKDAWVDVR